ncbi:transcription factor atoh8 [Lepisosteus oculatus]|uniref:transcription factor atoh8 n=1 Tax=Lepisosteus oculatus TaxID=7918 RepID=UPI0035F504B9
MKNPQLLGEGNWKSLYGKEIHGMKKFKRKSRDAVKHINGIKSFKQDPKMSEHLLGDLTGRNSNEESLQERATGATKCLDHVVHLRRNSNTAIDMRTTALPVLTGQHAPPQSPAPIGKDTFGTRSTPVTGYDHQQSFSQEQALQSRILLCQHPSESSYTSVSQSPYRNNNSDPTASPRKRLGETSGVVTEIKAIQQTRRLLANARERTRVHTISAAFEALRKQVPCYSYGQKLSKLAILRIACNYILSLAQLADLDYTSDHSNMSFSECVEQCTRTLQAEGRSKKRKE